MASAHRAYLKCSATSTPSLGDHDEILQSTAPILLRGRSPCQDALPLCSRHGRSHRPAPELAGTPLGVEPAVLKGRRGGTDEFLGRGTLVPPSPWCSGQGGRPLDKCLVQLHADAVVRKSHAA